MKKLFLLPLLITLLIACNSEGEKKNEQGKEENTPTCNWVINPDSTRVSWTAFKTTDKVGVGGQFTKFMLEGVEPAEDLSATISNARIIIDVSSTNTGNPDRDQKIINEFFMKMTNTDVITANVVSIDIDNQSATLKIKMNDVEQEVPMVMSAGTDGSLILSGSISTDQFMADEALASLNQACFDLHKGADGVSKTWPDVEITVRAKFEKDCK